MNKILILIFALFIVFGTNSYGREEIKFLNLQWKNGKTEIEEAHVDDKLIIYLETKNIPDNEIIPIEIWEETDHKFMDFIKKIQGTVKNGIVELEWAVEFDIDNENTNYAREIEKMDTPLLIMCFW